MWLVCAQKSGADIWLGDICVHCLRDIASPDRLYRVWSLHRARHRSGNIL